MKHKSTIAMLAGIVCLLTVTSACGSSEKKTAEGGASGDAKAAMGRYMEEEVDVSASIPWGIGLTRAEDQSLLALDNELTVLSSKDEGKTWEPVTTAWEGKLAENEYVISTALSKQGDLALITGEAAENETELTPVCRLLLANGGEVAFQLPVSGETYADNVWFGNDGSLFASANDGSIYELNTEDGSLEVILELQERAFYVAASEAYVAAVNGEGITLYDRAAAQEIEDENLKTFGEQVGSQQEGTYYSYSDRYALSLDLVEKEGTTYLYLFCKQGIFRHSIGGNVMEQVVDGKINTMGDPSLGIAGGIAMENDSFLVLFFPGKLASYTYDPNVPTVPEVQLTVYSLENNPIVKQGIAMFQKAHPEAYVKLTIGMDGESVTREDAIKKLNTEILAGKGPDLLVLDNMPIDSYIQKGMLLNLTSCVNTIGKEEAPLSNITNSFQTESGLFAIPAQFSIPLAVGEQDDLTALNNLSDMADKAEALRAQQPQGKLFGVLYPDALLDRLFVVSKSAWENEKGVPEEGAVLEFLTQAKRIWDAERQGITEEMLAQYETMVEQYTSSGVAQKEAGRMVQSISNQATELLLENQLLAMAVLSDPLDFAILDSVLRMETGGNKAFSAYAGQSEHVYYPKSILGINAQTGNVEIIQELLKTILSSDNLNLVFGILPNNEAALAYAYSGESITGGKKDESFGTFALEKAGGEAVMLPIYWPDDTAIGQLDKLIRAADTAYLKDELLETAVTEEGIKALNGEIGVEEAVSNILRKVSIYLSE